MKRYKLKTSTIAGRRAQLQKLVKMCGSLEEAKAELSMLEQAKVLEVEIGRAKRRGMTLSAIARLQRQLNRIDNRGPSPRGPVKTILEKFQAVLDREHAHNTKLEEEISWGQRDPSSRRGKRGKRGCKYRGKKGSKRGKYRGKKGTKRGSKRAPKGTGGWRRFLKKHRGKGHSMKALARMYHKGGKRSTSRKSGYRKGGARKSAYRKGGARKSGHRKGGARKKGRKLSAYNKFMGKHMRAGMSMKAVSRLWKKRGGGSHKKSRRDFDMDF